MHPAPLRPARIYVEREALADTHLPLNAARASRASAREKSENCSGEKRGQAVPNELYELPHASLREQLASKELELLELRLSQGVDKAALKESLRDREKALAESSENARGLQLSLQSSESARRSEGASHRAAVDELSKRVKSALREIAQLRQQITAGEEHRAAAAGEHQRELASRDALSARRAREMQVMMARLQALADQAEAAGSSEIVWRQRVASAGAAAAELQSERHALVSQLEAAARRVHGHAQAQGHAKAEVRRLERELAESKGEGEQLRHALQQHRRRSGAIEKRLGQLARRLLYSCAPISIAHFYEWFNMFPQKKLIVGFQLFSSEQVGVCVSPCVQVGGARGAGTDRAAAAKAKARDGGAGGGAEERRRRRRRPE